MRKSFEWEKIKQKSVIVYGAGSSGKKISMMLKKRGYNLLGMAVSVLKDSDEKEYNGIRIREIGDWQEYSDDSVIVIATFEGFHEEITQNCKKHGFKEIIPRNLDLSLEAFKYYLIDKGVDYNKNVLRIENCNFVNPFCNDIIDANFLCESIVDIVAPAIWNDCSLCHDGPYESENVKLSEGDIVFDLGANLGVFSVLAASKGCYSFAFEPTPELHPVIDKHSELNGNRIKTVPYAVSDKCEMVHFYKNEYTPSDNTMIKEMTSSWSDKSLSFMAPSITIDDFVRENKIPKIDFIKADIQGSEKIMISGAVESIKRFEPKLSICTYHLPNDTEDLTKLILSINNNYKIQYGWGKLYASVQ